MIDKPEGKPPSNPKLKGPDINEVAAEFKKQTNKESREAVAESDQALAVEALKDVRWNNILRVDQGEASESVLDTASHLFEFRSSYHLMQIRDVMNQGFISRVNRVREGGDPRLLRPEDVEGILRIKNHVDMAARMKRVSEGAVGKLLVSSLSLDEQKMVEQKITRKKFEAVQSGEMKLASLPKDLQMEYQNKYVSVVDPLPDSLKGGPISEAEKKAQSKEMEVRMYDFIEEGQVGPALDLWIKGLSQGLFLDGLVNPVDGICSKYRGLFRNESDEMKMIAHCEEIQYGVRTLANLKPGESSLIGFERNVQPHIEGVKSLVKAHEKTARPSRYEKYRVKDSDQCRNQIIQAVRNASFVSDERTAKLFDQVGPEAESVMAQALNTSEGQRVVEGIIAQCAAPGLRGSECKRIFFDEFEAKALPLVQSALAKAA